EGGKAALVPLDGDDPRGAFEQQRAREPAGPRPDLDDGAARQVARDPRDPARQVEVQDEVLAEALFRCQPQARDDLTERRQPVRRGLGSRRAPLPVAGHAGAALARLAASRAARSRAAESEAALALPVPAMSNAVPWSVEVRTNGRPRVTFTARSNANVLMGMRAWSWYMAITASYPARASAGKSVSAGCGPVTSNPCWRRDAMAGAMMVCSSVPIAPSSPAWGLRPVTAIRGRRSTPSPKSRTSASFRMHAVSTISSWLRAFGTSAKGM